ncbi:MAG: hypothetical protein ACM3SQ_18885 [Betaproteobacteria bacterium]
MDDRFMHALQQAPPPDAAARIRARLRASDVESAAVRARPWRRRALAGLAAAGALTALAAWPSARASAQAFLDLFRVVNFTAVPVDLTRLDRLSDAGLDLRDVIGRQVEMVTNPGTPQVFLTPEDASTAAGLPVRGPAAVPASLSLVRVQVQGEAIMKVTADVQRLRDVLDALGITDLQVPDGLDGATATVRVPPVARIEYANGPRTLDFMEARSPEVSAPAGLDLPRLGEIALRIAGLEAAEAHTLAQAIDWRNTFVVPVPSGAGTFRQVDVRGARGLLVETTSPKTMRSLAWSSGGVVYGLTGNVDVQTLLVAAESVQ